MPKIFCCYRRDDSTHQAGRIFDHLAAQFGKHELFRDVDSMPLGLDFRRVLSEQVAQCDVLLAIIGDTWLRATDAAGARRLDNPGDFVRIEIESALRRDIPVVPVLVGQAPVPQPGDLPECLRELAFRHGLAVRADPDFHHDVERLIRGISEVLASVAAAAGAPAPPALPTAKTRAATARTAEAPRSGPGASMGPLTRSYLEKVLKPALEGAPGAIPGAPESDATAPPPARTFRVGDRPAAPMRRRLLWAAALFIALGAALVLAIMARRGRGATAEDPLVESRRAGVRREVESIRRQPTELLNTNPTLEWEDVLPPVDYSAFEILSDERVVDLRQWKPVPPERASERVCAASMTRRLRLRKVRPTDDIRFEFRTTGAELFVSCPSHPTAFRVMGQRSDGVVGDKGMRVRQLTVDVREVPLQAEFTVRALATYWNSLQKEDDLWFGVMGYESSFKVSLLVVFPEDKPFNDFRLMVAPTKKEQPTEFQDRKILFTGENRDWLYWEIPDPKEGHVYSMYWTW